VSREKIKSEHSPTVFLCHSSQNKPFVRRLSRRLARAHVSTWVDEAEILVGDSLIEKIGDAIDVVDYVAVVLSKASIGSEWVQRELRLALTNEFAKRRVVVLPILLEAVAIPPFLRDKMYADFTPGANHSESFTRLVTAIRSQRQAAEPPQSRLSLSANSDFQDDLRTILATFRGERVHFAPYVPEDVLRNATNICKFTDLRELIWFLDSDKRLWRAGGKTAVIFSSRGVYFEECHVAITESWYNALFPMKILRKQMCT
jgi:TIR domain